MIGLSCHMFQRTNTNLADLTVAKNRGLKFLKKWKFLKINIIKYDTFNTILTLSVLMPNIVVQLPLVITNSNFTKTGKIWFLKIQNPDNARLFLWRKRITDQD